MPKTAMCLIDHATYDLVDGMTLQELDQQLQAAIKQANPTAKPTSFICSEHLVGYRMQKMDQMIAKDYQQNKKINQQLTHIMQKNRYQVVDVNRQLENSLTVGQRVADAVARFGGSWAFIISFLSVMLVWMLLNVVPLFGAHFDPYPFILLNLFLSMVAAIQAPLIMMSQNRAAEYDRLQR